MLQPCPQFLDLTHNQTCDVALSFPGGSAEVVCGFSRTEPRCPVEELCVSPAEELVSVLAGTMEKLSVKDKELIRDSWESLGKNKVPHGVVMFTR